MKGDMKKSEQSPLPKATDAPASVRDNGETILVVDDEESMRGFLSGILAKEGYHVLRAADGEEALSVSESFGNPIHMLITDVMLPIMNGKELADRLCSLRPDIKVLFVSGYSRRDFWPDDACEDQTDWLPKPFTSADLRRKVRLLLDQVRDK